MPELNTRVKFNTVKGPAAAIVIDQAIPEGASHNPDDDHEVVIFASHEIAGDETGLTPGLNLRYTHLDPQAGGISL